MPVNSFSVGRDVTVDITADGNPLRLNLITGFSAKPVYSDIKVKGLDGMTRHARLPDGWQGEFDVERTDAVVDQYFAQLEANYYKGKNEKSATITETIQNPDGSVSSFKFDQVLLKLDDAGKWEGDKTVKMKISFVAATRTLMS